MAISFTGKKRIRKTFGRIPEVATMPNLIEVQRASYDHFLQMGVEVENRVNVGLQEVFRSVFPIRDFSERAQLDFVRYELETPKYDVEECQQRGMNYRRPAQGDAAAVGLGRRRGHRRAHDPRHQGAGRLYGRHAADDAQRHLHHQRHRARHRLADAPQPRRVFRPRQGQDPFLGQVPVRRAGHSLSRLLARFRVRRQGPPLCPHRPPPQAAGDDVAAGARRCPDGREAGRADRRGRQAAAAGRGQRHVEGGDPLGLLRHASPTSAASSAGRPRSIRNSTRAS